MPFEFLLPCSLDSASGHSSERRMHSTHSFPIYIPVSYRHLSAPVSQKWPLSFRISKPQTHAKKSQSGTNPFSAVSCSLFRLSNCSYVPKKLLDEKFHGRRPVGRPRMRWEDITRDFSLLLNIRGWWKLQQENLM